MVNIKVLVLVDIHVCAEQKTAANPYGDDPFWRLVGYQDNSLPAAISKANSENVDLIVVLGDIINGDTGGTRAEHWQEWVDWVDGSHALSDGFNAPVLYSLGNWDIGAYADASRYNNIFDNTNGIGTILPSGQENAWWPSSPSGITAQSPCAYTLEKNGFVIISLCNPGNDYVDLSDSGLSGGTPSSMTQNEWLAARLSEAEAAGKPTIILTHYPLKSNDDDFNPTDPTGVSQAISNMEAQAIKPIVLQAHIHRNDEKIVQNGVTYFNFTGDVQARQTDDTDRYSHSILELIPNAIWSGTAHQVNGKVDGYGYQETYDFKKYALM